MSEDKLNELHTKQTLHEHRLNEIETEQKEHRDSIESIDRQLTMYRHIITFGRWVGAIVVALITLRLGDIPKLLGGN